MPLIIREMQIKTTMRFHLTYTYSDERMATITNPHVGKDVGKMEPWCTVGGNADLHNHYGKQYRGSSKKLKMELP